MPSRRTMDRIVHRHHQEVKDRGSRSAIVVCPGVTGCAHTATVVHACRVLLLPRACTLTGERVTFILSLTRTVRGHREVSRAQNNQRLEFLHSSWTWRENLKTCVVQPRWGTCMGNARQDTLPIANDAGIHQAEKKQKAAHRIFLSLDNRGPHKCSALTPDALSRLLPFRSARKAMDIDQTTPLNVLSGTMPQNASRQMF